MWQHNRKGHSDKLLGVYISNDLNKQTHHVDYILTKKANKRLYSVRVLKQCGTPLVSLAKVFVTIVRPILDTLSPYGKTYLNFRLLRSRAFRRGLCISNFPRTITMRHYMYLHFLSRHKMRDGSTYVRSTLLDYRTKTTRYTLLSLNWRKLSIIMI